MTLALLSGALAGGCVGAKAEPGFAAQSLDGLTLTYRFENGRTYQAAYAEETVRFEQIGRAS